MHVYCGDSLYLQCVLLWAVANTCESLALLVTSVVLVCASSCPLQFMPRELSRQSCILHPKQARLTSLGKIRYLLDSSVRIFFFFGKISPKIASASELSTSQKSTRGCLSLSIQRATLIHICASRALKTTDCQDAKVLKKISTEIYPLALNEDTYLLHARYTHHAQKEREGNQQAQKLASPLP